MSIAATPGLFGPLAALAGTTTFVYLALAHIPLGVAVAVQFLGPLAVATAGSKRALDLAWIGLAGLGVYLITGAAGGPAAMPQLAGLVLAAASAACWAGYILANAALGGRPTAAGPSHWRSPGP